MDTRLARLISKSIVSRVTSPSVVSQMDVLPNARVASSDINVTSKLQTIMPLAIHRSVFCRISSNGSNLSMAVAQS